MRENLAAITIPNYYREYPLVQFDRRLVPRIPEITEQEAVEFMLVSGI